MLKSDHQTEIPTLSTARCPPAAHKVAEWPRGNMNPKNNYSPALQEDGFEALVIFPVSARQFGIKDMLDGPAGVEDFLWGIVWVVTRVV